MEWAPNPNDLETLAGILSINNRSSSEVISASFNQLEEAKKNPDFLKYITFIFSEGSQCQLPTNIRIIAGFTLKSQLKLLFRNLALNDQEYIKRSILGALIDEDRSIRNASGVLITQIVTLCGLKAWPALIPALTQMLQSNNVDYMCTGLSCLAKIMEDSIFELDSEEVGYPLNTLIPTFLSYFQHPNKEVVRLSVNCMRFSIDAMPNALLVNMEQYLQGLSWLLNCGNPEIMASICNSLVSLLSVRVDALSNCLEDLFRFMIQMIQYQNSFVAIQATEFWTVFATLEVEESVFDRLKPFLPELVPLLIHNMRYDAEELERMNIDSSVEEHNGVRPFIYHADTDTKNIGVDDDNDGEWSLRRASAWALDNISNTYGTEVVDIITPLLERGFTSMDWIEQESCIFSLGAISDGCCVFLTEMMKTIYPLLFSIAKETSNPLLFSITSWVIGQYSEWVFGNLSSEHLNGLMESLLTRMLDGNAKVQLAAVCCISVLVSNGESAMECYYDAIIKTICQCFQFYSERNQRCLLGCIGDICTVLLDSPSIDISSYASILLPPIIQKWNMLSDLDDGLLSILECLYYLISAMGESFRSMAEVVYTRCIRIIDTVTIAYTTQVEDEALPEKMFVVSSLDVISSIIGCLKASALPLIRSTNLVSIVIGSMQDSDEDVRQSSFALFGDLSQYCYESIREHYKEFILLCVKYMNVEYPRVCNNVLWSLGELAMQVREDMSVYAEALLPLMISINSQKDLSAGIRDNSTIAIGRLCLVCSSASAYVENVYSQLCMCVARLKDGKEKENACKGLCRVLLNRPGLFPACFRPFVLMVSSWESIGDEELGNTLLSILNGCKSSMGENWESFYANEVDIRIRQIVQNNFNFYCLVWFVVRISNKHVYGAFFFIRDGRFLFVGGDRLFSHSSSELKISSLCS